MRIFYNFYFFKADNCSQNVSRITVKKEYDVTMNVSKRSKVQSETDEKTYEVIDISDSSDEQMNEGSSQNKPEKVVNEESSKNKETEEGSNKENIQN